MTFNPDLPAKTDGAGFEAKRSSEVFGWGEKAHIWILRRGDQDVIGIFSAETGKCLSGAWSRIIGCEDSEHQDWIPADMSRGYRHKIRTDGPFEIEVPADFET